MAVSTHNKERWSVTSSTSLTTVHQVCKRIALNKKAKNLTESVVVDEGDSFSSILDFFFGVAKNNKLITKLPTTYTYVCARLSAYS